MFLLFSKKEDSPESYQQVFNEINLIDFVNDPVKPVSPRKPVTKNVNAQLIDTHGE
jgi:hypothetical protein